MSFPKYKDVETFKKVEDLDIQLLVLQKQLFNLQLKKIGPNPASPHFFKHLKCQIRHLQTKKSLLFKSKGKNNF